jgi:anti-sigma regulatory factor (Ser/Thr protein kinase)
MKTLLLSVGKQLVIFPSISRTLAEYLRNAPQGVWQSLRKNQRLHSFLPSFSPKKGRSFEMTIRSHTAAIDSTVHYFQERIAKYLHSSDTLTENIGLCLRESLANAIIHGNLEISPDLRNDSWEQFENILRERQGQATLTSRQVVVRCEMKPQYVKLEVEDEGAGFDAERISVKLQELVLKTKDMNLDVLSSGGRGLVIIVSFMDHVFWNPRGNCITMIKRLSKAQ